MSWQLARRTRTRDEQSFWVLDVLRLIEDDSRPRHIFSSARNRDAAANGWTQPWRVRTPALQTHLPWTLFYIGQLEATPEMLS
jgi:hypothetical protein